MAKKTSDVFHLIGKAVENGDLEAIEALEKCLTFKKGYGDIPFAPHVVLKSSYFGRKLVAHESSSALPIANSISRAKRRIKYNLRKTAYDGPVLVSEGDSWFQYPIRLDDVIDHLGDAFNIFSVGAAGDLLSNMVLDDEFMAPLASEKADYFLLSGGGNDMLGNGRLRDVLHDFSPGMTAADLFHSSRLDNSLRSIQQQYERIFDRVISRFSQLKILCHSYDYVLPREDGKWLGIPMQSRGIPKTLWKDVGRILIDSLSDLLLQLQAEYSGHVYFVDCRGVVGDRRWHDELHPTSRGYRKVSDKFLRTIKELEEEPGLSPQPASSAPFDQVLRDTMMPFRELPPARYSLGSPEVAMLIKRGDHRMLSDTDDPPETIAEPRASIGINGLEAIVNLRPRAPIAARRKKTPTDDPRLARWQALFDEEDLRAYEDVKELLEEFEQADSEQRRATREELRSKHFHRFERLIGDNNLFEINFLSRGQIASRSVGRITVVNEFGLPVGTGTGFLVAPGLLLTNNHVLPGIEFAANSYVLFDYEYDAEHSMRDTERFDLRDDLFVTDVEYDFTFVSTSLTSRNGRHIDEYGYLPMIEHSGKALKGEPTSIIQHANGQPKQIAIRDSRILGRKRQFVYYETDTNAGSSGGPVLNDEWFPVALHHRAVPDYETAESFVANRGIRISSIFDRLEELVDNQEGARDVLDQLENRDTLLGAATTDRVDDRGDFTERLQTVFHEVPYENRKGYDENFLGIQVALPSIEVPDQASMIRGTQDIWIPYEHFSIVNFRKRKLALVTASNVDFSEDAQQPDPDQDYRRKALTGVTGAEGWFKDPRIPLDDQLPDLFYTDDRASFQKGHLVRRNDVTWGTSYEQVRRANGDTYHLTNCSPQIPGFNQHGIWAKLERLIGRQGEDEKYCVFSGPVFSRNDRLFHGIGDNDRRITVKIPSRYWKVVVAREGPSLQAFAFVLRQSLRGIRFREFDVPDRQLKQAMISIPKLESMLKNRVRFPAAVRDADQIRTVRGRRFREQNQLDVI